MSYLTLGGLGKTEAAQAAVEKSVARMQPTAPTGLWGKIVTTVNAATARARTRTAAQVVANKRTRLALAKGKMYYANTALKEAEKVLQQSEEDVKHYEFMQAYGFLSYADELESARDQLSRARAAKTRAKATWVRANEEWAAAQQWSSKP